MSASHQQREAIDRLLIDKEPIQHWDTLGRILSKEDVIRIIRELPGTMESSTTSKLSSSPTSTPVKT